MYILKHNKTIRSLHYTYAIARLINNYFYYWAYEIVEVNQQPWYIEKMHKQWLHAEADRLEDKIIKQTLSIYS